MSQRSDDKSQPQVDNRTPAKVAAQLQQDMFAHPSAGPIPVQASTLMLAIQELRRLQEACDKHSEADILQEAAPSAIEPIEWQALLDALTFTAQNCGLVSDAHNSVVDKVEAMIRRSDGESHGKS